MCRYCNSNSDECEVWIDPLDNTWYLDVITWEWDEYNDGYVHQKIYINYCPYCGRSLKNETEE